MTWSESDRRHLERAAEVAQTASAHSDLAALLHARWYAAPTESPEHFPASAPPLESMLRAAHAGGRSWSGPVPVFASGVGGAAVVEDQGERRTVSRGDYATLGAGAGLAPRAGSELTISRRRGCVVQDGWWYTWNESRDPASTSPWSRIYLAPVMAKVATLVGRVTELLLSVEFAWSLRVGADPATLARADGAALQVPDTAVARLLEPLVTSCSGLLCAATPPLTVPLSAGVAWAQRPATAQSHGELICGLVAQAWRERRRNEPLADAAARTFVAHRRDPRMPGLRPRSPGWSR
ncbi:MAG: T3SS effector HopA1 family protein [Nocardioides sp.]